MGTPCAPPLPRFLGTFCLRHPALRAYGQVSGLGRDDNRESLYMFKPFSEVVRIPYAEFAAIDEFKKS